MIKKLLTLAAAGIISYTAASCEKDIPTEEIPAKVTLENVYYHEFTPGVPTCVYDGNGGSMGSMDNPKEGAFALRFDTHIQDPNLIFKVDYEDFYTSEGEPIDNKQSDIMSNLTLVSPTKKLLTIPLMVTVTDYQKNVTGRQFDLSEIVKTAKPCITRKKIEEECPWKIE